MKISGQKVNLPPRDVVIFPRASGQLLFHIQAIPSWEAFDAACPRPEPPKVIKRGKPVENTDDETYKMRIQNWLDARQNWLILKALELSENDIEWETVDINDASTWSNVEQELKEAGLSDMEFQRLAGKVYDVNALTERAMDAARENFLLMMSLENAESDSRQDEPISTQSGQSAVTGD
jgi:hypothetical protein